METLGILAILVLLLAAAAPALYTLQARFSARTGQLELWRMMQRRGLSPAEAAEEPKNLALAIRRCTLCPSLDECHAWLDSGAREGAESFCPNASYLKKLEGS
jgi:hypothetical protein